MLTPPRYLFVCTANLNRSPMAAAWAQRHFERSFVAADVRSAGTHAGGRQTAAAYTIDVMREEGFDLRAHRSQRVTADLLQWADKAVVMEPMHHELLCELAPQFAERVVGLWPFLPVESDAVPDPHEQDLTVYRHCRDLIAVATRAFVEQELKERRSRRQRTNS